MMHVIRLTATLVLVGILAGCASGPPKPRKLVHAAEKAYKAGDHAQVLSSFQVVLDTTPEVLDKRRYKDEVAMYHESQIAYGLSRAADAEKDGKLLEAWVWQYQVSLVEPGSEQCGKAALEATRLHEALAQQKLSDAQNDLQRGNGHGAMVKSAQSLWYGGDVPAQDVLVKAAPWPRQECQPWLFSQVTEDAISGPVRTDSMERLVDRQFFAPYEIPIYFGDAPRYYVPVAELRVKHMPVPQYLPKKFERLDGLYRLSAKAKKLGADAVVNVRMWTKSKKAYTLGTAVKFVSFEAPATPPVSVGEK